MHYETIRGAVPSDTLLIHGNLASNLWWEPTVQALEVIKKSDEQSGRPWTGKLILAEWRGCGLSAGPVGEADMDFAVLANDYIELLGNLGIERAAVVGHATGGMIALHALAQAPEIFTRGVVLNPVPKEGMSFAAELQRSFPQLRRDRAAVRELVESAIYLPEKNSEYFEKLVDQACATHPLVWAHILKRLAEVNVSEMVTRIRQPVLVLHGEHDPLLSVGGSQALAEALPEGVFKKLEHQGHCCQIENPALFAGHFHHFLFG